MNSKYRKNLNFLLMIFIIIIPIFFNLYSNFNHETELGYLNDKSELESSIFSKNDYNPILGAPEYGLGNITLTKLNFNEPGIFNYTERFPQLNDDLLSGALSIIYNDTTFIKTIQKAQFNNLDETTIRSNNIIILINESISVQYNISIDNPEAYLIYNPLLYPREIKQILFQNDSSSIIQELESDDYSIDEQGFIKFEYFNYFNEDFHNFSMYFIFEYSLELLDWQINQGSENILEMVNEEHSYSPLFYYNFSFIPTKYNQSVELIPADNFQAELILNPLDKELFYEHKLLISELEQHDFLEADQSLNFTMSGDNNDFSLNFKLNFTIKLMDPVDFTWAIDRLVEGNDIRERIYIPKLVSGPKYIFLNNVSFIESTITIDQIESASSLFGRSVEYYDILISVSQQSVEYSLIFTRNAVKRKGLRIVIPYIITGEIAPFILKYRTNNNLRLVLTDNINMPLVGSRVELYYYNKLYGTYISNNFTQPMAPAYSDENGGITIKNVPTGNYTIKIYQEDRLIKEGLVNTFSQISVVKSNIMHFPIWIIIFGSISFILGTIGLLYYIKNKNRK